jgi:hypothetical protein
MASQAYLTAVICEFEEQVAEGFKDDYEAKKALWRTALTLLVMDGASKIDTLTDIALGAGLRPFAIERTITSARARAQSDGDR